MDNHAGHLERYCAQTSEEDKPLSTDRGSTPKQKRGQEASSVHVTTVHRMPVAINFHKSGVERSQPIRSDKDSTYSVVQLEVRVAEMKQGWMLFT